MIMENIRNLTIYKNIFLQPEGKETRLEKRQEEQCVGEKLVNSVVLKFKFFVQQNIS